MPGRVVRVGKLGTASERLFAVRAATDAQATSAVVRAIEQPTGHVEVVCPLNDFALKALEVQGEQPKQIL